jgi:RimJ/RimL family protein N-acetyltransferase
MLSGRVIRLEPMTEEHIPGLCQVGLDERIWRLMVYGSMRTEADMRAWVCDLLKRQEKGTDLPFVAVMKEDGRLAGATRYMNIAPEHRGLEIGGTWYGVEYQGTVVNPEAKYLLMRHAFETLGAIRVQLKTDLRNERSQRAIEKLGAVKEGVLRNHMILPGGQIRSSVMYSVIDAEWPEVKRRLVRRLGYDPAEWANR